MPTHTDIYIQADRYKTMKISKKQRLGTGLARTSPTDSQTCLPNGLTTTMETKIDGLTISVTKGGLRPSDCWGSELPVSGVR